MDKDEDYLSGPLIDDVTYNITESRLQICSPHTQYIRAVPHVPLKKDAILRLYFEVLRTAKQCGAKISYRTHLRRSLLENWDAYEVDCREAQRLYAEMLAVAKMVESRGLHYGTTNDSVLKTLDELKEKYQALFWRKTGISRVLEIHRHLQENLESLSRPMRNITIYL